MSAGAPGPLWVVGDVHGALGKLQTLLRGAGLIGVQGEWTGRDAHLAFLGDYLDRGPDGLGVVRLVRRLQAEAPGSGGGVTALLGNHEVMFLAAARFGPRHPGDPVGLHDYWLGNGGQPQDLSHLTSEDEAWLRARPALARAGPWLLAHADSLFYLGLGSGVEEINRALAARLDSPDPAEWAALANAFVDRLNFVLPGGAARAGRLLAVASAKRLVHGHTPVPLLLREGALAPEPEAGGDPNFPLLYAGGLCLGVDSAMAYLPHAGFVARLGEAGAEEVVRLATPEPGTR